MRLGPQLTAFFTSAAILASSAVVNSFSAKEVGHMAPSSRFALFAEAERSVPRFERRENVAFTVRLASRTRFSARGLGRWLG